MKEKITSNYFVIKYVFIACIRFNIKLNIYIVNVITFSIIFGWCIW
jgi:hypothetical protein